MFNDKFKMEKVQNHNSSKIKQDKKENSTQINQNLRHRIKGHTNHIDLSLIEKMK